MSNFLDKKKILIINVESDDIDLKKGKIFQITAGVGLLNSSKWMYKTWRVDGVPIPEREIALFENGLVPKVDEDSILPIKEVLTKIVELIEKTDLVCCFFNSFHIGMIYAELQRANMPIPSMHICDLFLIFKESHKYEKNLKKSFEAAINYYGESLSTFGDANNLSRKSQASKWLLDRLIEDDDCHDWFMYDSISSFNRAQSNANVLSYYSMIKFLKGKGKSTDTFKFFPWPYHEDGSSEVDSENPLFESTPEVLKTLIDITIPDDNDIQNDERPFEICYKNEVHRFLTEQLNLDFDESEENEFELNDKKINIAAGIESNNFIVHLNCDKEIANDCIKLIESWPIRWANANTFMKVTDSSSIEDKKSIKFKLMEKLKFD